jgi:HD-GYP domain-containing protein (c-di-GMP phosphodiesterase class II)
MKDEIYRIVLEHKDTLFSAERIERFLQASRKASFWFFLEDDALEEYLYEWKDMGGVYGYTYEELREIAVMFADIVDTKSPFTAQHSFGVASLSLYLGRKAGLDKSSLETLELAALLHDLGKLRIDDEVLNKPGKLNVDERLLLNRHGFDSDLILRKIKGFRKIAHLASLHHETLDGEGYPYRLKSADIPLEARIIAVSDIFQALIQNRPYREAMSAEKAFEILSDMAESGKLDKKIIGLMRENLEEVYNKAVVSV